MHYLWQLSAIPNMLCQFIYSLAVNLLWDTFCSETAKSLLVILILQIFPIQSQLHKVHIEFPHSSTVQNQSNVCEQFLMLLDHVVVYLLLEEDSILNFHQIFVISVLTLINSVGCVDTDIYHILVCAVHKLDEWELGHADNL